MNKADISKDKIIETSINLLKESRDTDLNMRKVAVKCNVSVGTIYNYFPDKSQLMLSVIEEVWKKAFSWELFQEDTSLGTPAYIGRIYSKVYVAQKDYYNFFMIHRNLMDQAGRLQGKSSMLSYIGQVKAVISRTLAQDKRVKDQIWSEEFTPDGMADFIFQQITMLLARDEENCDFLVRLLEKCLYG